MWLPVQFEHWRAAVGVYLDRLGCPRPLDEMPAGFDTALDTWYRAGVRAYVVAVVLVALPWPGRATLNADPLVPDGSRAILRQLREAA